MRRLFFFIFLCVLALNCRASDAPRLPPMEEVLSFIGQKAVPSVRRCVLRKASEQLPQWLEWIAGQRKQLERYRDVKSLALGLLYQRQLDNICGIDEDYDSEFEASLWSRPKSFIEALTVGKLLSAYDSRKIRTLVDAYNGHQRCWFDGEISCQADESDPSRLVPVNKPAKNSFSHFWEGEPFGFTEITLHDFEKSFVLLIGVFNRINNHDIPVWNYQTVVFRKNDLAVVSSYDGLFMKVPDRPVFLIAKNAWTLNKDEPVYGNSYSDIREKLIIVYDVRNFRELMNEPLPGGTIKIEIQKTPPREIARFHVTLDSDEFVSAYTGNPEDVCTAGWTKHFEYRYSIGCRAGTGKCELTKHLRLLRSYKDCLSSCHISEC